MAVVVTFLDDDTPANPLAGVVANFTQGGTLIVSATSAANGEATVSIPAGVYNIIVSYPGIYGYSVTNPYQITVVTNNETYDIELGLFVHPVATGMYCRCSGHFLDSAGATITDAYIYFQPDDIPLRYGNAGTFPLTAECQITDGYGSIDLIRGGVYWVMIPGLKDRYRVTIPDSAWASLPDVVFPIVYSVSFDPASVTFDTGDTATVAVTVTYRSGLELSGTDLGADWPITFASDDIDVVTIAGDVNGNIVASATGAGSATISATRCTIDDPVYFYAEPGVVGTLGVTVSS